MTLPDLAPAPSPLHPAPFGGRTAAAGPSPTPHPAAKLAAILTRIVASALAPPSLRMDAKHLSPQGPWHRHPVRPFPRLHPAHHPPLRRHQNPALRHFSTPSTHSASPSTPQRPPRHPAHRLPPLNTPSIQNSPIPALGEPRARNQTGERGDGESLLQDTIVCVFHYVSDSWSSRGERQEEQVL